MNQGSTLFSSVYAEAAYRNENQPPTLYKDIRGDIRHPVDYLVDLIETQAYRENTIDTMWLDHSSVSFDTPCCRHKF